MRLVLKLKLLWEHFYCGWKPSKYAAKKGVRFGKNVRFYSIKPSTFGSEPWLITIGDNVWITADCKFINHDGGVYVVRNEVPDLELTFPIEIGNNVFIGNRVTFLPGTKIGDRSIVGACALLKGEYPPNSVLAGVPARVICTVDEYLEKAKEKSLHFGHLLGEEKAEKLKKYYNITHI